MKTTHNKLVKKIIVSFVVALLFAFLTYTLKKELTLAIYIALFTFCILLISFFIEKIFRKNSHITSENEEENDIPDVMELQKKEKIKSIIGKVAISAIISLIYPIISYSLFGKLDDLLFLYLSFFIIILFITLFSKKLNLFLGALHSIHREEEIEKELEEQRKIEEDFYESFKRINKEKKSE